MRHFNYVEDPTTREYMKLDNISENTLLCKDMVKITKEIKKKKVLFFLLIPYTILNIQLKIHCQYFINQKLFKTSYMDSRSIKGFALMRAVLYHNTTINFYSHWARLQIVNLRTPKTIKTGTKISLSIKMTKTGPKTH